MVALRSLGPLMDRGGLMVQEHMVAPQLFITQHVGMVALQVLQGPRGQRADNDKDNGVRLYFACRAHHTET
jgi:hypothetical protein